MITDLWIENFKGIGKRQHIPLRPVTLLFGANSAGKSTVLHALLLLREVVVNGGVDPRRSLLSSNSINLGGFENLLHRSSNNSVSSELQIRCRLMPSLMPENFQYLSSHYCGTESMLPSDDSDNYSCGNHRDLISPIISGDVTSADWEIGFARNASSKSAHISHITVSVNSVPIYSLWVSPQETAVSWVNIFHALFFGSESVDGRPEFRPFSGIADSLFRSRCRQINEILWSSLIATSVFSSIKLIDRLNTRQFCTSFHVLSMPSRPTSCVDWNTLFQQDESERYQVVTLWQFMMSLIEGQLVEGDVIAELGASVVAIDMLLNEIVLVLDLAILGSSNEATSPQHEFLVSVSVPTAYEYLLADVLQLLRRVCIGDMLVFSDEIGVDGKQLPLVGSELPLDFADTPPPPELDQFDKASPDNICDSERLPEIDEYSAWKGHVQSAVDEIVRGSTRVLRNSLDELTYVGPKRTTVPRTLTSELVGEGEDWSGGLAAWRWLLACDAAVVRTCSDWLCHSDRLDVGYGLVRSTVVELPLELARSVQEAADFTTADLSELKRQLSAAPTRSSIRLVEGRSGRLMHPQDLGEGVTQVVPVVVSLVRNSVRDRMSSGFVLIEQPELHLHPRIAAKVGDLLLSTIFSSGFGLRDRALIETHSEHLILRILRRIRQTTNGELPEHIPPVKPDDVCVLWVDNLGDGTTFQRLRIDDQGEFLDRWPRGFFSERAEELY